MAFLASFGKYLPSRIVSNGELASRLDCTADWMLQVSGIEERRWAAAEETVESMAVAAARDCLEKSESGAAGVGMIIVASGSAGRRFPGPAAVVAHRLGLAEKPALDVPMASAGSLFGLAMAASLTAAYGSILLIGAEKMSSIVEREPLDKNVAILFGDGAGACLVSPKSGKARVVDSLLQSDGAFAEDLQLGFDSGLSMNGRSVIMQASRKIPRAIAQLLERSGIAAGAVEAFLMHQANGNLIDRVAKALGVETGKFHSNIRRYGNTSSASMLIAAAEWWEISGGPSKGSPICFAAFGAGFHWGALLAVGA